eukprot:Nitzschia sp. Nitz4//scaffold171_size48012//22019//22402//NITZ4_007124-RA/size48012-processed-gene-0.3-mRNA-1//1//CDS//3329538698//6496//frame0
MATSNKSEAFAIGPISTSVINDAAQEDETPLALPEPRGDSNAPRIRLGETVQFEELGPIILNTDGSTRRIANWDKLTDEEKEVTWRRISKRNEERRQALIQKQQESLKRQAEELAKKHAEEEEQKEL